MNILLINQTDEMVGGSDVYFRDTANLLRQHGHVVYEFYATSNVSQQSIYPKKINFDKPNIHDVFSYCYNFEAKKKLHKFLDGKNIDIAHLNIYYGQLTSSILNILSNKKIPIVQTLHEYKLVCPTYKMLCKGKECHKCKGNTFYHSVLNRCNRGSFLRSAISCVESYISMWMGAQNKIKKFICVSDFQKNKIREMWNSDKLMTIHNYFPEYKLKEVNSGNENKFFVYVGRIEREKGIELLLKIAEKRRHIDFVFVGEGSFLDSALRIKKELSLDNVNFVGKVSSEKVGHFISKSIALILPSLWMETFGLVVLEAFSYSKPVISSNYGGMSEIITHDEDGILANPGDLNEFLRAVDFYYENKNIATEMGESGYKKLIGCFSEHVFYENLLKLYQEVIA